MIPRCALARAKAHGATALNRPRETRLSTYTPGYYSQIDAEPLHRYCPGGYHPVSIGDWLGQYQVVHKLGWGSCSTVWLARDDAASRLVAVKVAVAELGPPPELEILRQLTGTSHVSQIRDHFVTHGPNGAHHCLVMDVSGVAAQSRRLRRRDNRLPAAAAWSVSRQIAKTVQHLHSQGIYHAGNINVAPRKGAYSDVSLLDRLGPPERADVCARSNAPLTKKLPEFVVDAVALPGLYADGPWHAELIDFGQASRFGHSRQEVICPLVIRAPELLFTTTHDHRIDVWALACTLFELVTGQPPFDNYMPEVQPLVQEWIAMFGPLPEEWRTHANAKVEYALDPCTIHDWLVDVYHYDDREPGFSEQQLDWLGELLSSMMQYKPEDRPSMDEVLEHPWFRRVSFQS